FIDVALDQYRVLLSFPTRRSSDLSSTACSNEARPASYHDPTPVQVERHRSWRKMPPAPFDSLSGVSQPRRLDSRGPDGRQPGERSEEHTSELQSRENLVCRLLLEK